jgi:hypothetical protein
MHSAEGRMKAFSTCGSTWQLSRHVS